MPIDDRLIATIRAFVEAESWDDSHEILDRHPELVTPEVDAALENFAHNAERVGNAEMAHTFRVHRRLLRRCAEVGTVAAFLELEAPAGGRPPGPGLQIPREVLTDELLVLSREIWAGAANTSSHRWWERRIQLLERGIALTEGNADAAPMWATFHVELGNTLLNTPVGDRSANNERAIASFDTAARVWTRDVAPQQWATIQENLGKAYDQRVLGDREENRRRANAYYENAGLAIGDTRDDDELTTLVHELGDPLAPGGPRRRIEVCERVIELLSPPFGAAAELWVGAHATLAENLEKLKDGDRAEHLERAVEVLERALDVANEDRHPEGWAAAHAILGVVLFERIRGDRAENLEGAIREFELSMRVRTRQAEPQAWAATANNLANAYCRRFGGDRAGDLEKAIGLLDAAMTVRTKDRMPDQWAASMANLGNIYSGRVLGDRADNLEEAIGCYDDALTVLRQDLAPARWAQVMNARGAVYVQRARGDHAQNIETAIETLNAALAVRTRKQAPGEWAVMTRNLANAYSLRTIGDKQDNLAMAIAAYEAALAETPREANPREWAASMIGLGNAHAERSAERGESWEQAIATYNEAAGVVGRVSAPDLWVATRIGLGNAHLDLMRGGRAENVEQAIRHLEDGLSVATRVSMPDEWAKLQHGLAEAYTVRRLGDHASNLKRAVEAAEAALTVRTREADPHGWALTSQNLARALSDPELPGARSDNQARALATLEAALEVISPEEMPHRWAGLRGNIGAVYAKRLVGDHATNLRMAVAAFIDALKTLREGSIAWAQAQRNLGSVYGDLAVLAGDQAGAELVEQAFTAFAAALPVLQEQGRVVETRDTAKGWGDLAFRLGRWRDAANAYEISMDAADVLYGASVHAGGKRSELDESVAVCQRAALAWAYAAEEDGGTHDDLVRAIVAVERSRARWLGETLAQDRADLDEARTVDAAAAVRYRKAAARLRELEDEERRPAPARQYDDPALTRVADDVLTARLHDAQAELGAAVAAIRGLGDRFATFLDRPGFGTVADALRPGQAIAYLLVTKRGSRAVLAHRPQAGPPTVDTVRAALTTEELVGLLFAEDGEGGYLAGQVYAPHALGALLASALPTLGERLVAPVARRLRELGVLEVTLVPCGLLGALPLHAAQYVDGGVTLRLIDELDVSTSPSARVLATARSLLAARPAGPATLAGLANATPSAPLEHAERELHDVAALFGDAQSWYGEEATATALTGAAARATHVHLACHGTFDLADPLKSGLELADGRLTVRNILKERPFAAARLVVASACKSAVSDVTDLPDEVVGLPAGILCGGNPGVVGTLWSVDDRSTALLMGRFYAYHLRGNPATGEPPMPPARALREAQRWLSTATPAELATALPDLPDGGTRDIMPPDGAEPGPERTAHPYSDPFYWAPFVFLGA